MSYFDTINGFMDNIDSQQNAINSIKNEYASQAMGDLEDKFSLIKQKALEGVPDVAGDILNYTTQGVQALSGTYATIRALKNSKLAKSLSKASGKEPAKPDVDVDDFGLPKGDASSDTLNELSERLNRLRQGDTPDDVINESLSGGAYDNLARSRVQGNIEPNSAFEQLRAARQAAGGEPEPPTRPPPEAAAAEPLVPREVDPATGQEIVDAAPQVQKLPTEGELGIGADGFTDTERKAIATSNDPAKLERSLAEENAVDSAPSAAAGKAPFEDLFPNPPKPLSLTQKAEALAQTSQEGGAAGGSALLAKVTQQASNDKPLVNPESAGASAVEEASTASKLATAADVAEAPLAIAGMVAGDIKGKGSQTASQVINDAVGTKQAYNLGRRGKRLYDRRAGGEADDATDNPMSAQAQKPDVFDLDPEDVSSGRPTLFESATQEVEGSEEPTFEQTDFRINIQPDEPDADDDTAQPAPQEPAPQEPAPQADQPPAQPDQPPAQQGGLDESDLQTEDAKPIGGDDRPPQQNDDIQDFYNANDEKYFTGTQEDHDAQFNEDGTPKDAPDVSTDAQTDAVTNLVTDDAENVGKTLGERILTTLGAESGTEAVLDSLGVVGEVAGVGLMLGGIFHDIFGKKKQEEQQAAQEAKAQAQEQAAEANLRTQNSAVATTTGAVDLASLHNVAGANASVGIV